MGLRLNPDDHACFRADKSRCTWFTATTIGVLFVVGFQTSVVIHVLAARIVPKLEVTVRRRFWFFMLTFALSLVVYAPVRVLALVQSSLAYAYKDQNRVVPAVAAFVLRLDSVAKTGAQISRCAGALKSVLGRPIRALLQLFMGFVWVMFFVRPIVGVLKELVEGGFIPAIQAWDTFLATSELVAFQSLEAIGVAVDALFLYNVCRITRRFTGDKGISMGRKLTFMMVLQASLSIFVPASLLGIYLLYGPTGEAWRIVGPAAGFATVALLCLVTEFNEEVAFLYVRDVVSLKSVQERVDASWECR